MGSGSRLLAQITGPAKDKGWPQTPAGPSGPLALPRIRAGGRSALPDLAVRSTAGLRRQAKGLFSHPLLTDMDHKSDQANRAISTSQLNASPRLHIWPINVVVFHG